MSVLPAITISGFILPSETTLTLGNWGQLLVAAYLLLLVILGWQQRSRNNSPDSYLFAGRKLTVPAFIATLVSSWYGGILAVGEYTFLYGISNWFVFALPYYFFALIFAIYLAPRIRRSDSDSLPEQFRHHFGSKPAILSAVMLAVLTLPAPYLLIVAMLLQVYLGISFALALVGALFFSLFYLWLGGLNKVVQTDKWQLLLMFAGFLALVLILHNETTPIWHLSDALPAKSLQIFSGQGPVFLIAWFFIAAQTLIDPNFFQRCRAAQNPKSARRGILWSILLWFFFDTLTTISGLYAILLLPQSINPSLAYPLLANAYLPDLAVGLFAVALLATAMSSLDSFTFVSGMTIGRDILSKLRVKTDNAIHLTRIGMLIALVLSIALVIWLQSIIAIWFLLGNIAVPLLVPPLLLSRLTCRINPISLFRVMLLAIGATLLFLSGYAHPWLPPDLAFLHQTPIVVVMPLVTVILFFMCKKTPNS
jgi:SSS family solute:Na+ symporter